MNLIKFSIYGSIFLFFIACGGDPKPSELFAIQIKGNTDQFKQSELIELSITNPKNKSIESVSYFIDDVALSMENGSTALNVSQLGNKKLSAEVKYDGGAVEISKKIKVLASKAPDIYTYAIVNEFPHDKTAFTQGLEFYNDTLYESTGRKGKSSLRKVDYTSGKVLEKIDLNDTYFGEGITVLNKKIYYLTWQSGTGFIYDLDKFEKIDSFKYGKSKEGWGLCNDGQQLYKSDGTEKIWLLNPNTLVEQGFIQIVTDKSVFNKANELEYVDGKIYANVWQKPSMMIIDAVSGAIEGVINFSGLEKKVTQHAGLDVLNGVAYHPKRKTFFVTGKNWDKLFEVRFMKKE